MVRWRLVLASVILAAFALYHVKADEAQITEDTSNDVAGEQSRNTPSDNHGAETKPAKKKARMVPQSELDDEAMRRQEAHALLEDMLVREPLLEVPHDASKLIEKQAGVSETTASQCVKHSSEASLRSLGLPVSKDKEAVLVLGSGGLIGAYLSQELTHKGYHVLHVSDRHHVDLRQAGALDVFDRVLSIKFCFFLAFEVGGSKFLSQKAMEDITITHNKQIYEVVFPYLRKRNIPFVFASTQLYNQPTPYGKLKKMGEEWIGSWDQAKIVRFWNVYGKEHIGVKSHVLSDWVDQAARSGMVNALTSGHEQRQFLYGTDCADGLIAMMEHFEDVDKVTDLTTGEWLSLREVGSLMEKVFYPRVRVVYNDEVSASSMKGLEPNMDAAIYKFWQPRVTMMEGLMDLYRTMMIGINAESRNIPYLSLVVAFQGLTPNVLQSLKHLLDSLAASRSLPAEVICVASRDPEDLIRFLGDNTPSSVVHRVRVVVADEAVKGLKGTTAYARSVLFNIGSRQAKGKHIMFLPAPATVDVGFFDLIGRNFLHEERYYMVPTRVLHFPDTEVTSFILSGSKVENFSDDRRVSLAHEDGCDGLHRRPKSVIIAPLKVFIAVNGFWEDQKVTHSHLLLAHKLTASGLDNTLLDSYAYLDLEHDQEDNRATKTNWNGTGICCDKLSEVETDNWGYGARNVTVSVVRIK